MANRQVCIFCGEQPGMFQGQFIVVGKTNQFCCKSCAQEIEKLNDLEQCQRALRMGLAADPDKIQARINTITEAEAFRPKCLRCGGPMKYQAKVSLDASPMRDGLLTKTFDLIPCACTQCGRMEFYSPAILKTNPKIAYLYGQDT